MSAVRSYQGLAAAALTIAFGAACGEDSGVGPGPGPLAAVINANITADRTLYADTVYTISGFISVGNGATLTIQPGTEIQGDYNVLGSSLFILRGANIDAQGTSADPIVFTSSRPVGQRQPGDWGGLIIVGNGIINRTGTINLEGTGVGAGNPLIEYSGGADNADDSGTLRYVRVEFAGFGPSADTELNTFTLAAVGSGTELDYLQALNGLDDSFEFFGGAVDGKHFVSYDAGDDHFDMAEGYVGRLQHLIAFQTRQVIPRTGAGNTSVDPQGIENDGCNGTGCVQTTPPYTIPLIANFTLVGPADGVFAGASGGVGMMLRRGTGGFYVNGVVARWERAAISLRDQNTLDRATAADLIVNNVHVADVGATFQTGGSSVQGTLDTSANAIVVGTETTLTQLFVAAPNIPTSAAQLDWTPAASASIATGGLATFTGAVATKGGTFVTGTAYRGAADPAGADWWAGWTNYADN